MSEDAQKPPKFPWDYDVPKNAFWRDLNYSVDRSFLQCYTESEISKLHFDESLSRYDKLQYQLRTLDNTLTEKETKSAPTPFKDVDYIAWRNILLGLSTIEHSMGNLQWKKSSREKDTRTYPGDRAIVAYCMN